jgi:hypothetical protein
MRVYIVALNYIFPRQIMKDKIYELFWTKNDAKFQNI